MVWALLVRQVAQLQRWMDFNKEVLFIFCKEAYYSKFKIKIIFKFEIVFIDLICY